MTEPSRDLPPHSVACDAATIALLALAPAAGVGIARFAYSLLLPDMRASLHWSYAEAGFMNTINAAGYLAGAFVAAGSIRRIGQFNAIFYGTLACVISLAVSAMSGNFVVLSAARLVAGVGAAIAFVAGGVAATHLAQRHPQRSSLLLSLYYIGPGLGILVSGAGTPWLLDRLGPGSWSIAWGALAVLAAAMTLALLLARAANDETAAPRAGERVPAVSMAAVLVGYVLFSTGAVAYLTFMIAWLRDAGAGAAAQSLFWSSLGLGGVCSPVLWSGVAARLGGSRAVAAMTLVTGAAIVISVVSDALAVEVAAAFVFGSAFFAVVAATTVFVRRNFPVAAWPSAVGIMTLAFGLGQAAGPLLSGAITDVYGSLTLGLLASAALLAVGAGVAWMQRDLAQAGRQLPLNQL